MGPVNIPISISDISLDFRPNAVDSVIMEKILRYEATPKAIKYFAEVAIS